MENKITKTKISFKIAFAVVFVVGILGVILYLIKTDKTNKPDKTTIDKKIYNEIKFSRLFIWIDKTNPVFLDEKNPFKAPKDSTYLSNKQHLYQGNEVNAGEWRIKMITLPDKSIVFRFIFLTFFVAFNPDGYYDRQSYDTYQTIDSNNNLKQVSKCDVNLPIKYVDFTFFQKDPLTSLYIFRNVTDPTRYITVQNNISGNTFTSEVSCS